MKTKAGRNRSGPRGRILIICGICTIVLVAAIGIFLAAGVYEDNFGQRFETYEPLSRSLEEFQGLQLKECVFLSDRGQRLAGYTYYKDNVSPRGVLVIAHGFGGGGHNSYMDVADYFASNGYIVFAYDATGNDKSEGDSVRGLPQGVVDLDYALRHVKADEDTKGLPIVLFGHSWGGYAVANVLRLHPDVKAVVSVSGFNRSADLIQSQGEQFMGKAIAVMMPFFNLYERFKFGKVSSCTAMDGFESSDAGVMIIHSSDDEVVPPKYGYDLYYEKYRDDGRFEFIRYETRGHNYIYYTDAGRAYMDEFNAEFKEHFGDLPEIPPEEKAAYLHEHLDKARLYEIDLELFGKMLAFYDKYI